MLYANQPDATTTIIGAADTLTELERCEATLTLQGRGLFTSLERAGVLAMLADKRLAGYRAAPLIARHADQDQRDAFAATIGLTLQKPVRLRDTHKAMFARPNVYAPDHADTRGIGRIHGIEAADPWDRRNEEQKRIDADHTRPAGEADKRGEPLRGPFQPDPAGNGGVHVADIRTARNADGSITVGRVGTVKAEAPPPPRADDHADPRNWLFALGPAGARALAGMEPRTYVALFRTHECGFVFSFRPDPSHDRPLGIDLGDGFHELAARIYGFTGSATPLASAVARLIGMGFVPPGDEDGMDGGDGPVVSADTPVTLFFKVAVTGAKLSRIAPALAAANLAPTTARDHRGGCWLVFIRLSPAERARAILAKAGFAVEQYAVNREGERVVPRGVAVLDTEAPPDPQPRPWNARADELAVMTGQQVSESARTLHGAEFIYCGRYLGAVEGTVVHIAPASWFAGTGRLFDRPLGIAALLPMDLEETSPGVYHSRSRDYLHIAFDLGQRGMKESTMLQLHLNNR